MSSHAQIGLQNHSPWEGERRFVDTDPRPQEMRQAITTWYSELGTNLSTPMGNAQLTDWLRMQARIPYASARNAILLAVQQPDASELRTFDGWVEQHDCTVRNDETAIWLWDPIVARQCPECGRGHFEHEDATGHNDSVSCTETPPSQWERTTVKYTPTALFAREQMSGLPPASTDGPIHIRPPTVGSDEYRPDLDENAAVAPDPGRLDSYPSPDAVLETLPAVADELDFSFTHVPPENWDRIEPIVDSGRNIYTMERTVKAVDEGDPALRVEKLLETFAYMVLGEGISETTEVRKRSTEAYATAYALAIALGHGTRFTLPGFTDPPTFKKWEPDSPETLRERCERIQHTLATLVDAFVKAR
jgi:hypothetical protein